MIENRQPETLPPCPAGNGWVLFFLKHDVQHILKHDNHHTFHVIYPFNQNKTTIKHSTTILATAATIILSITTLTSCRDRIDDEPSTRTVTFNTSWTEPLLLSI